jgi:hypothetical protein
MQSPRLRNVEKYKPLYPLNDFPKDFGIKLGKELICLLASRGQPRVEGSDWEEIFARVIGAEWKPSNVGLDDIAFEQTAWGAKTVKNKKPFVVKKIRLISGRNSPVYSFGDKKVSDVEPAVLGEKVLAIWNERVAAIRKTYKHLRTIVLIKSDDLLETAVFEYDTVMFDCNNYWWQWNSNNNLEGYLKTSDEHVFTWQPHGSQFTIIEKVPENRLKLRIKQPPTIPQNDILKSIKFAENWIEVL